MRIALQDRPEDKTRLMIRVSEFSFESYPLVVKHVFRAVPAPKSLPGKRRSLWQNLLKTAGAFVACRKKQGAQQTFCHARRPEPSVNSQF